VLFRSYRSLFPELLREAFAMEMPPLRLEASTGTVDGLERYAGVYAWPDRRAEVRASAAALVIDADGEVVEARPIDERTFLVDANDPDTPTVTFGSFDAHGRPQALYLAMWALPRVAGGDQST